MDSILVELFQTNGYDVVTASHLGLIRAKDETVLQEATRLERAVFTFNCADFQTLHGSTPRHAGILLSYTVGTRYMTNEQILWGVTNLVLSGLPFPGRLHVLNEWCQYQPNFAELRRQLDEG